MQVVQAGRVAYGKMLELQLKLVEKRQSGAIGDVLILCEHPPVITLGISARKEHILFSEDFIKNQGVEIFQITRGGDVTFHGPGQLVGYPIVHLSKWNNSIKLFVEKIEISIIETLRQFYNIESQRIPGLTGVWVGQEKITAIGFAVKKWVTYHGFAFNIATNLDYFNLITPCGIRDKGVTSLEKLCNKNISLSEVSDFLCKMMGNTLLVNPQKLTYAELEIMAQS